MSMYIEDDTTRGYIRDQIKSRIKSNLKSEHDGIESIQRVIKNRQIKYEIILKPNYSFESTGTQIQYCDESDIEEMIGEIIYCDGVDISRQ